MARSKNPHPTELHHSNTQYILIESIHLNLSFPAVPLDHEGHQAWDEHTLNPPDYSPSWGIWRRFSVTFFKQASACDVLLMVWICQGQGKQSSCPLHPPLRCFNTSPAVRRDSLAPNLSSPSIPALRVGTAADWTDVGRALPTATGQRKHQEWRICGSLVFKSTFIDQRTATFTFLSTLMLSDTSSIRNETASTPSLIYH